VVGQQYRSPKGQTACFTLREPVQKDRIACLGITAWQKLDHKRLVEHGSKLFSVMILIARISIRRCRIPLLGLPLSPSRSLPSLGVADQTACTSSEECVTRVTDASIVTVKARGMALGRFVLCGRRVEAHARIWDVFMCIQRRNS